MEISSYLEHEPRTEAQARREIMLARLNRLYQRETTYAENARRLGQPQAQANHEDVAAALAWVLSELGVRGRAMVSEGLVKRSEVIAEAEAKGAVRAAEMLWGDASDLRTKNAEIAEWKEVWKREQRFYQAERRRAEKAEAVVEAAAKLDSVSNGFSVLLPIPTAFDARGIASLHITSNEVDVFRDAYKKFLDALAALDGKEDQ